MKLRKKKHKKLNPKKNRNKLNGGALAIEFAEVDIMVEIIGAVFCVVIALIALFISVRSFKEKGFLFNNAYIWASKQERKQMDKKPYYRQTAVAFSIITLLFLCMAIEFVLKANWMYIVIMILSIVAVVYAIVSSIRIEKRTKK